jgi:hypothetical protein
LIAFIADGDPRMARKRHGKEAVQRLDATHRQHQRMPVVIGAKAQPEKVADRRLDAGCRLAVPIDAQDNALQVIRLIVGDGEPDMGNAARPVGVQHRFRHARLDPAPVGVAAGRIGTGGAVQHIGLLARDVGLPAQILRANLGGDDHGRKQQDFPDHIALRFAMA